jgi:hypothetical protein
VASWVRCVQALQQHCVLLHSDTDVSSTIIWLLTVQNCVHLALPCLQELAGRPTAPGWTQLSRLTWHLPPPCCRQTAAHHTQTCWQQRVLH